MAKQLFYDAISVGQSLPVLVKHPTTRQLVMFAGAAEEFYEAHYDKDFAISQGLPGVMVHGMLMTSFLGQLVTDWMGDEGTLKKFSCQYRAIDWPRQMKTQPDPEDGETWLVKGKVTKKYQEGNEHLVDCEIWVQNGKGEITTPGKATVALPSRG